MIKRLLAFDLAILIAVFTMFLPFGFAIGLPSGQVSLPLSIVSVSPPWPYHGVSNLPGLGEVAFAEPIIEYFFGMDYQIDDAFYIDVLYRFGAVTIQFDHTHYDYDYLAIVMSPHHIYYMMPIIIDDYMLFDFTNVVPGDQYKVYIIRNLPYEEGP